ncbi:MAG: hypothetical protein EHM33_00830 [Chloroflexi bacterium]|nr:MAG: hypothetical protein EHM33_00830 [Chloroflexota bacterium]
MKHISPTALAAFTLALAGVEHSEQTVAVANRKQIVKRSHTKKQKPGRGKPAKGYDPVTKTWGKPTALFTADGERVDAD